MPDSVTKNINRHLQALVGERNPRTSLGALHEAGNYILQEFNSLNLITKEEPVGFEGTESCNILAFQEGTDSSQGYFVLAAHYDSVEGTPGADDNASAVAALLEIARSLEAVPLKVPLLYAAFTLEEYGFIGSKEFIRQAQKNSQKFFGMISLEMVGYRDSTPGSQSFPPYMDASQFSSAGDFIAVVGNEPSAELTHAVAELMHRSEPNLPVERLVVPGRGEQFPEVNLSDHSPFWDHGTPAVMITDTAFLRNPNYHQPTDTLDTLDIDFIRDVVQGTTGFLQNYLG